MTQVAGDALVLDTGPLRHFAERGWLNILRLIAGHRLVVIPASVEQELRHHERERPDLAQIREASWITVDRGDDLEFVVAFAEFERNLEEPR